MTGEEIKALAARLAAAGYTAKDLQGMRSFAGGGDLTDYDGDGEAEEPVYGGELAPAVVKPAPVEVTLATYPISKRYPISHSALNSAAYPSDLARPATPEDFNQHPVHISKTMDDPTYNLITNNCSDDTGRFLGDALHTNFIGGITTPAGLQRRVINYLDRNKLPYDQSDIGVYTTIPLPWYDYRKAVDNYNDQMMQRALGRAEGLPAGGMRDVLLKTAQWYRDQPRLQWHLDTVGNVVNGRADGGFIRRFDEGTPGSVVPVGDARLLGGISGIPTVERAVPYGMQAPMAPMRSYTVQAGDNLSTIANLYGTTIEELSAINNISNPNFIRVGQQLSLMPQGEEQQPVPVFLPDAEASPTPRMQSYTVRRGDNLSSIAKRFGISVDELARVNDIKNKNLIREGQSLKIADNSASSDTASDTASDPRFRSQPKQNLRDMWKAEKEWNKDNLSAIMNAPHDSNYVVLDKASGKGTVYNPQGKSLYTFSIATGLSGDDYNPITYTKLNPNTGKRELINYAGNNSTPAGITQISDVAWYHGHPTFIRSRYSEKTGDYTSDVASSMHLGQTHTKHISNGCVRVGGNDLDKLKNYIGKGTMVYTLPEKAGSRFQLSEGSLNFVADNPYGDETPGKRERHWDDYNVQSDKSYRPVDIQYHGDGSSRYQKHVETYLNSLEDNKSRLMKEFGVSSEVYNRIALLAAGIAQQESAFGTHRKYIVRSHEPDWLKAVGKVATRGVSWDTATNLSRGWTQMKLRGDNAELQKLYDEYGVNQDSVEEGRTAAVATMLRLLSMYKNEVQSHKFTDVDGNTVDKYDALLYKWMGRNKTLTSGKATPTHNTYLLAVKNFADQLGVYYDPNRNTPILYNTPNDVADVYNAAYFADLPKPTL